MIIIDVPAVYGGSEADFLEQLVGTLSPHGCDDCVCTGCQTMRAVRESARVAGKGAGMETEELCLSMRFGAPDIQDGHCDIELRTPAEKWTLAVDVPEHIAERVCRAVNAFEPMREALKELIEVAELRGDSELPHPSDDPLLWSSRMQTAWHEAEAAIKFADGGA